MIGTAEFVVYGTPSPKGSMRGFVNKKTGKAIVTEATKGAARATQDQWKRAITERAQAWREANPGPVHGEAVTVAIEFFVQRPASAPKRRVYAAKRPDIDKLVRLVLDCLKGVAYGDDALVVKLAAVKRYAEGRPPGARIVVRFLAEG